VSLVRESLLAPSSMGILSHPSAPVSRLRAKDRNCLLKSLVQEGIPATKRCEKGFSHEHAALRPRHPTRNAASSAAVSAAINGVTSRLSTAPSLLTWSFSTGKRPPTWNPVTDRPSHPGWPMERSAPHGLVAALRIRYKRPRGSCHISRWSCHRTTGSTRETPRSETFLICEACPYPVDSRAEGCLSGS